MAERVYDIVVDAVGTLTRLAMPKVPPSPDSFAKGAACKDVILNPSTGLWARVFLPAPGPSAPSKSRLPLLLYFHGGGFVTMSLAYKFYHNFLLELCKEAHIIIVAVEYRLAPEHRLPAAYEDALTSLKWLRSHALMSQQHNPHISRSSAEPWLLEFADFSLCYLMGDSSGGNIVHNLSVQIVDSDISPLHILGQIIVQPFIGGQIRTATELRMVNDAHVPLSSTDWLWRNVLPKGADRDHPYANPIGPSSPDYGKISRKLPKTLVTIATEDPMQERQVQLFQRLKEAGVEIHLVSHVGTHGLQLQGGKSAKAFIKDVVDFFHSTAAFSSKL